VGKGREGWGRKKRKGREGREREREGEVNPRTKILAMALLFAAVLRSLCTGVHDGNQSVKDDDVAAAAAADDDDDNDNVDVGADRAVQRRTRGRDTSRS